MHEQSVLTSPETGNLSEIVSAEVSAELRQEMDDLYHNIYLRALMEKVARDLHGLGLLEKEYVFDPETAFASEAAFMQTAQKLFDFRKGQPRGSHGEVDFAEDTLETLDCVTDMLKMKKNTTPQHTKFDMAFVTGSGNRKPADRLDYLVDLMEQGRIETDMIVLLGSERVVSEDERHRADRAQADKGRSTKIGERPGNPATTEFELLKNTAAAKFDIADDDWILTEGIEEDIPEEFHRKYRIAHATTPGGKTVCVISAPMIHEDRYNINKQGEKVARTQANTADCNVFAAELLSDYLDTVRPGSDHRSVTVTNAIFGRYQGNDTRAALATFGIRNETVGFTQEYFGLPEWPGGAVYYIQEVLSTLRGTRAGRDYHAAAANS